MLIDKIDNVTFRAFSNLASVALCSMGLISFWLSSHRTSENVMVFLTMLFVSLLIRFCAIYLISRNNARVIGVAIIPIFWFGFLCYLLNSDSLDDKYINFWLGLLFLLIGFVRAAESFDAMVVPFRFLILSLAVIDFIVGICLLAGWPSSILWNTWVVVAIDLISTGITLYLFTINILNSEVFFPQAET